MSETDPTPATPATPATPTGAPPPSDILPPRDGSWTGMSPEAKIGALDDAVRMLEQTVKSLSARLRMLGNAMALMTADQGDMNDRTFALADACLTISKAVEKGNADHPRGNLHRRVLDMMTPTPEEQEAQKDRISKTLQKHADSKAPPADPPPGEAGTSPTSPSPANPSPGKPAISPTSLSPADPSPSTPSTESTRSAPAVDFDERQLGGVLGADGQVHSDADRGL